MIWRNIHLARIDIRTEVAIHLSIHITISDLKTKDNLDSKNPMPLLR